MLNSCKVFFFLERWGGVAIFGERGKYCIIFTKKGFEEGRGVVGGTYYEVGCDFYLSFRTPMCKKTPIQLYLI